jgi:putative FmdB family regulatory protein
VNLTKLCFELLFFSNLDFHQKVPIYINTFSNFQTGENPMPIYEYGCNTCGHELEVMQKINDSPLEECPSCGNKALKKKISVVGFQLKGKGWYATDFKNQSVDKSEKDTSSTPPPCGAGNCACAAAK